MKKEIIRKALIIISIILFIVFIVNVYKDYIDRHNLITITFKSAVVIREIMFLVPSAICIIVSIVLKSFNREEIKKKK